ncbi:hypothetical protein SISSUDRAFT_1127493 [Sistotremastrum suecicum HHB10207 ss-3]|uniref:Transmembrane protein n=1 Tax=Sistotremastrum suecicum HHB10207 ss-3 TaxID=1314776 RepID=A0A166F2A7_9AGAM|nr:hypothetical protein SISSUDRAFT_1127493 [Sistotremastrum suecicum HHB10207 ss-3]
MSSQGSSNLGFSPSFIVTLGLLSLVVNGRPIPSRGDSVQAGPGFPQSLQALQGTGLGHELNSSVQALLANLPRAAKTPDFLAEIYKVASEVAANPAVDLLAIPGNESAASHNNPSLEPDRSREVSIDSAKSDADPELLDLPNETSSSSSNKGDPLSEMLITSELEVDLPITLSDARPTGDAVLLLVASCLSAFLLLSTIAVGVYIGHLAKATGSESRIGSEGVDVEPEMWERIGREVEDRGRAARQREDRRAGSMPGAHAPEGLLVDVSLEEDVTEKQQPPAEPETQIETEVQEDPVQNEAERPTEISEKEMDLIDLYQEISIRADFEKFLIRLEDEKQELVSSDPEKNHLIQETNNSEEQDESDDDSNVFFDAEDASVFNEKSFSLDAPVSILAGLLLPRHQSLQQLKPIEVPTLLFDSDDEQDSEVERMAIGLSTPMFSFPPSPVHSVPASPSKSQTPLISETSPPSVSNSPLIKAKELDEKQVQLTKSSSFASNRPTMHLATPKWLIVDLAKRLNIDNEWAMQILVAIIGWAAFVLQNGK